MHHCLLLIFFFLWTLCPLIFIFFTYTTLFRSVLNSVRISTYPPECRYGNRNGNTAQLQDRKSTRLNSSHVSISYAVFCLKKKIKLLVAMNNLYDTSSIRTNMIVIYVNMRKLLI